MTGSSAATLGVVTVCMNRQHHLAVSAAQLASWPHHQEHLIIDWSSDKPIERDQLPPDPRIRLLRVSGEFRWNLCRAYNFAVQNCQAELLLKLDADCWPGEMDPFELMNGRSNVCWFGSGAEGRLGQFLMSRQAFLDVGGFNEVLEGYGFDDKELKARLQAYGWSLHDLKPSALHVITHSIHERVSRSQVAGFKPSALEESISFAQRRATSMSNRVAAAYYPWTAHRARSAYQQDASGAWRCVLDSVPMLEPSIANELGRLRRQIFWSRFLELPELHVKLLPVKLLPPDRRGVFKVRAWHRVYWHTMRRILRLPVDALALLKGCLSFFQ